VKNFAQMASPLHKLCEKASKFIWIEEKEIAFKRLKEALTFHIFLKGGPWDYYVIHI
jgi:hypothetical protein